MASPQRLPTLWQVTTYLFGVCLFSISFLVFLNSSVSFVITDIIGQKRGVGDAVGSLGFADELVAIFACPVWGMLSDRLGVRLVAVIGYILIGLALIVFVQASNVYPQLLLARMFFALGGAACTTMVTAILPSISSTRPVDPQQAYSALATSSTGPIGNQQPPEEIDSIKSRRRWYQISSSRLAGFVGLFTGCGALIALTLFLPLPSYLQKSTSTPASALRTTYYIVGTIAFLISLLCFIGLRKLKGQEDKGPHNLWHRLSFTSTPRPSQRNLLPYWQLFRQSIQAASNPDIGLGYIGGFVARASSVGISLFIPLLVNNYFLTSGRCKLDDPALIKSECKEAYVLAAKLTGVSQLVALLLAPAYGFLSDSKRTRRVHTPLLVAAICGIAGYTALCFLVHRPDPAQSDGSKLIYLWVSLIGASQIGAIVCSLGCISNGIGNASDSSVNTGAKSSAQSASTHSNANDNDNQNDIENEPLLSPSPADLSPPAHTPSPDPSGPTLHSIQGSIAGTYSLAGGVAILLLTKVGGALFDSVSPAAPFVIMAMFNGLLLLGVLGRVILGYVY